MTRVADSEWLRDLNRRRVLGEVRRRGAVARVDIAGTTGLSPATVTVVTTELIDHGLLEEAPGEPDRLRARGRPRVMLRLVPSALFLGGVKISEHRISAVVIDFSGETVGEAEAPVRTRRHAPPVLRDLIEDVMRAACHRAGVRVEALAGLGIGVPGFVDAATGVCHWSPILSEMPVNFARLMETRFACPVFVDNDANLATLAELWFGLGQGRENFVVVTVEHGVGMGLVIDGRIQRGARSLGAEFGHIKVQLGGALCRCGQRGCLEAYVADYAVLREASAFMAGVDTTDPLRMQDGLAELAARARAGDPPAAAIFRRTAEMLGMGLANLVNILDPGLIILSGERFRNELLFPEIMEAALVANSVAHGPPGPAIRTHIWGDLLWARGAAALALEGLFADPLLGLSTLKASA